MLINERDDIMAEWASGDKEKGGETPRKSV